MRLVAIGILCSFLLFACGKGHKVDGAMCGPAIQTDETDALSFDPWYRPQDRGEIEIHTLERSTASDFLPYSLVRVPDAEIKLERNNYTSPTSRITCETVDGRKYRIVQYPFDAVPAEDVNSYGYQATVEGRRVYAREADASTAAWSDVWWTDREYGDVWIASEEMTVDELLSIARKILKPQSGHGLDSHAVERALVLWMQVDFDVDRFK